METQLQFNETLTVEQFKARQNVTRIDVKKNQHTGKLFMVYGSETGAVSSKGIPSKPMISYVTGENGSFWLLHNEGEGGAPTLASF